MPDLCSRCSKCWRLDAGQRFTWGQPARPEVLAREYSKCPHELQAICEPALLLYSSRSVESDGFNSQVWSGEGQALDQVHLLPRSFGAKTC